MRLSSYRVEKMLTAVAILETLRVSAPLRKTLLVLAERLDALILIPTTDGLLQWWRDLRELIDRVKNPTVAQALRGVAHLVTP